MIFYTRDQLRSLIAPTTGGITSASATTVPQAHPPGAAPPPHGGVVPPVVAGDVVASVVAALRTIRGRSKDLARTILDGRALAKPGARDAELQRAASLVAWVAPPDATPEEVAPVLTASLAAMAAEDPGDARNPAPDLKAATEKIRRAMADAAEAREQQRRFDLDAISALRRAARASAPDAPTVADLSAAYTETEIAAFEIEHGATDGTGLRRRWVIEYGESFYVLVNGAYQSPISRSNLAVSLPRDLSPAPVEWLTYTADGKQRLRTPAEMLQNYATTARRVVADLSLDRGFYDPQTQTFHEAAAPRRRILPMFNLDVQQWLTIFGAEELPKLLDWLATVTRLDRQTCALFMSGPPSTGKTMLIQALARIWSIGGPTELGRILDDFNADLLRCPLIFADEKLPTAWRNRRSSAELRQIIGSGARTLSRKFLPNADLIGAPRLALAANNEKMLADLDVEDLGQDDLAAVSGRFLHIRAPQDAADFLRSLGGRQGTDGWVEGDVIAAHVLWLTENRQIEPGSRFLVEGHAPRVTELLATGHRLGGLCCEWVVRYLSAKRAGLAALPNDAVRIGDGRILVSTAAISEHWSIFIKSDDVPSTTKLGRTIANWSRGSERIGGHRYREVDPTIFTRWSEENDVGDPEAILEMVAAPLPLAQVIPFKRPEDEEEVEGEEADQG